MPLSDCEIIKKIKEGEIEYYSQIVNKYTKHIYNYVLNKLFYKKEDAEDIVQESFLSFYKAISNFDENKPIPPYLFEIVKNEIKMYLRARKKILSLDENLVSKEEQIDFSSEYNIDELSGILPDEQKNALLLYSEGYSYEEIAGKLNKPLNTIRTLIRRARLKMKETYGKT